MAEVLETLVELTKVGGAFVIVGASFYGVAYASYNLFTKHVLERIIKNYKEEKAKNPEF